MKASPPSAAATPSYPTRREILRRVQSLGLAALGAGTVVTTACQEKLTGVIKPPSKQDAPPEKSPPRDVAVPGGMLPPAPEPDPTPAKR